MAGRIRGNLSGGAHGKPQAAMRSKVSGKGHENETKVKRLMRSTVSKVGTLFRGKGQEGGDLDPEKEPLLFRGPSSSRDFYSPEAYGWKGKRGNKVSPVPMHENLSTSEATPLIPDSTPRSPQPRTGPAPVSSGRPAPPTLLSPPKPRAAPSTQGKPPLLLSAARTASQQRANAEASHLKDTPAKRTLAFGSSAARGPAQPSEQRRETQKKKGLAETAMAASAKVADGATTLAPQVGPSGTPSTRPSHLEAIRMKAALQATAAENVKLLRDIAQLEMDRDRLEARVRKAEAARAELSESAAALGERYRAEITHIKGRASSELRSVVEKYAEEVRALQDAREAAVLETEKAHAEARDVTAAYEELLTRHEQMQQSMEASWATMRAEIVDKSPELTRALQLKDENVSQMEHLEEHCEVLQSSSAPASPTSPLDVNKMQECALAEKARLLREILDCRPSLAAREQECAKLGEELAQLKYENEELLEVVGGAVRELEAEHCAAAARKAQVERLERAASESAKAAAAAKAKAQDTEKSLATATSWAADLEAEVQRLQGATAAAASELKAAAADRDAAAAERHAAATREADLLKEKAGLEAGSARLREELDTLSAEKSARTAELLGQRKALKVEHERATRALAERECEVRAAKTQITKLTRELDEAVSCAAKRDSDKLQLQVSDMTKLAADLASDVDDARADAESAERRRIVMERLLKDTLTEERIRAESTQRELRDKNDELERIKQTVQALTVQRNMSATDLEKATYDEIHKLNSQIAEARDWVKQTLTRLQGQPLSTPSASDIMQELERLRSQLGASDSGTGTASTAPLVATSESSGASKPTVSEKNGEYSDVMGTGWREESGPTEAAASGPRALDASN